MLNAIKFIASPETTTPTPQYSIANGSFESPSTFIFSPTMRWKRENADVNPSIATRESEDTFAVGFKETIRFATDTSSPWKWRRIVFSMYGTEIWQYPLATGAYTRVLPADNGNTLTNGPRRVWMQLDGATTDTAERLFVRQNVYQHLFAGELNVDWSNPFTAPIDANKVKLISDSTTSITSPNDAGTLKIVKRWHPFRKRIIYEDDTIGKQTSSHGWSAASRQSYGDIYIMDMFLNADDAGANNLSFGSDATYYWHER